MALSHVLSSPIADFTGTVTVFNSAGVTTTANATQIVRPSDWNSAHNEFLTLTGNTAGQSTMSGTNIVYQGGNNVTLSANGASLIFSAANQTAQTQSNVQGLIVSNTTYRTGDVSFSNLNGISFGSNGANIVTASYTVPTQTNQSVGAYAVGNTTQSTSGTIDARSLSFSGAGVVSVGVSNGSVVISANAAAGDGVNIMAAGTRTAQTSGTVLWSNANGVTFGLNTTGGSVMTASISQTNQTIGAYAVSNTTQSSSGTLDARSLSFQGAGAVSVGYSNGSVVISAAAGAQSNQSMGIYASSQTTGQSSSSTVDARSLSFVGQGMISVGMSAGSVLFSSPDTTSLPVASVGFSTGGNTAGDTGFGTDRVVFAGGANITLSGSTNAGSMTISVVGGAGGGGVAIAAGTQTATSGTMVFSNSNNVTFGMSGSTRITASVSQSVGLYAVGNTTQNSSTTLNPQTLSFNGLGAVTVGFSNGSVQVSAPVQTAQSAGLYALGNTTQNSSTTLDARTLSFNALGAMTMGYSNGSIQVSAPPVSSLVGAGGISLSSNGSTVTISYTKGTKSGISPYADLPMEMTQIGQGVMIIDPMALPDVQFDRVVIPIYNTNSSNSSGSHTLSFWAGLYSRNASTLSRYGSASGSFAVTHSGTQGVYASLSALRALTIPWTTTIADGQYWFALVSRTTSGGADGSYSHLRISAGIATNLAGMFSAATNASVQMTLGQGSYSATTAGMPASIAFSEIQGTGSSVFRAPVVWFASSTV